MESNWVVLQFLYKGTEIGLGDCTITGISYNIYPMAGAERLNQHEDPIYPGGEYLEDGRLPLQKLYEAQEVFVKKGWKKELIYFQKETIEEKRICAPVFGYVSPYALAHPGEDSLWKKDGDHGEEPGGPNANAREAQYLSEMGLTIPMVVLSMLNPVGYYFDWRYFGEKRSWRSFTASSVGDCGHVVARVNNQGEMCKPELTRPANKYAGKLVEWMLVKSQCHPPSLFIDFHEDELKEALGIKAPSRESYIYVNGRNEEVCQTIGMDIIRILERCNFPLMLNGRTRFGENVINGIVRPESDGSTQALSVAQKYYDWKTNQWIDKPAAQVSIVIETPRDEAFPLEDRIAAYVEIIHNLPKYWQIVSGGNSHP